MNGWSQLDPDERDRRGAAYVTVLERHPLLGVDHCTCGNEVGGGSLVLVHEEGDSKKVIGCGDCGAL